MPVDNGTQIFFGCLILYENPIGKLRQNQLHLLMSSEYVVFFGRIFLEVDDWRL